MIAECPGCNSRHLIADHLGWFDGQGNGRTVEDFVKQKGGIAIRRTLTGDTELTPEDLLGASKLAELESQGSSDEAPK